MSKDKLIPQLRFPKFEKDGEWERKRLHKVLAVRNEQAPKSEEYPLMAFIKDIGVAPKGDRYNREFLVNDGDGKKYKKTEYGDFIYSSNNLDTGSIGLNLYGSASISPIYSIFQTKESIDFQFIGKLLVRKSFINKMLRCRQGVVYGQWKIHESDVLQIEVAIPRLEEQQKISSCLSSLDELLAAHSNKLDALKDHKKCLMQNLFPQKGETVPKVRFPEFEDDGEWVERKLEKIAENLDSRRVPITSNVREKGKFPYYGASGIIDYVKDYIFDEDLLLISEDGANLIARVYPIAFSISGKTWVNNHAHVLKFENWYTRVFVEQYLNSKNIEDFLTGVAQPKLNRGNLDIIPIPLPNNSKEQLKIASCLSALDELITSQAEKIEQLQQHKKGLMQGLFPKIES